MSPSQPYGCAPVSSASQSRLEDATGKVTHWRRLRVKGPENTEGDAFIGKEQNGQSRMGNKMAK